MNLPRLGSSFIYVVLSILTFVNVVRGLPIHLPRGESVNVVVSLDPALPQHVHESQLEPLEQHLNILRRYSIGTEYLGYVASVDAAMVESVLDLLSNTLGVIVAEPDVIGYLDEVESNAPWGLGRISHRRIESDRQFQQYTYNKEGGTGVKVYLLDSGVYAEHEEFQRERTGLIPPLPRARLIKNFVTSEWSDDDLYGHGTHCAGTIGGTRYGVAKNVEIDVIKVCNGRGECLMSDIIAGLEYAVSEFLNSARSTDIKGSLISMSLGLPTEKSRSLALAARAAVRSGVLVVASAGNAATDACSHTPASVSEVLTVGATNLRDERAIFSNFGSCVDIFAPGESVISASNKGPRRKRVMSGTSMSTPHVSGLVAYYLSLADDGVFTTPEFIKGFIMSRATPNVVSDAQGSRNLLVFNG